VSPRAPNRRDDEVRQLLDTPHPAVPAELVARATARGRRTVRRRLLARRALWVLLALALVAGVVLAVLLWPDHPTASNDTGDATWWAPG
jgi:cell division septal protein FtsQ